MEKERSYARKLLVLGTVGLVSLMVLLPIMDISVANTRNTKQLWIEIVEPREGFLYIMGKEIMHSFSGRTVMFGGKIYRGRHNTFYTGIIIKAMASKTGAGISYVEFSMNDEVIFMDPHEPYEWLYKGGNHVFGWNTIKVVAYDNENSVASDEMDILLYMLKGGI